MSDVFNEIEDDIRNEKLQQFWKENGAWIIGGAILAVILTGALTFWRHWEYDRNTAATSELTRIVSTGDLKQLEKFGEDGDKNHAMVARFVAAGMHLQRGEKDQAIKLYNEIADTSRTDKTWRSLAKILSISQRLDTESPEKLEKELSSLARDKDPWRYTARELQALLAAKQNHLQEAVDILTTVTADPQAPADARARAFTLRDLYMADIPADAKTEPKS